MADILSLDGAVAVVTGAGRGLGRAHALALAQRGARIVVNDIGVALDGTEDTGLQPADEVVAEILGAGGDAISDSNSVSTPAGGESLISAALERFGRIDIVVNNAGFIRDKAFHKMTDEHLGEVLDVHLKGAVHVTRPAWSHMRNQGYGRVINTSSNAGLLGNFGQANYAAAKMGIVGLTRTLAIEGARYGVKANAIAPIARTRMTDQVLGGLAELADPSGVSQVVALLAHPSCPLSGEVLSVGAGSVARFVIGRTAGWHSGSDFTAEDVFENLERIMDVADIDVLGSAMDELELLKARLTHG